MTARELVDRVDAGDRRALARLLTLVERGDPGAVTALADHVDHVDGENGHLVGITGAPGAGKSTLVSAMSHRLRADDRSIGVLAVDPSSPLTGGALLGDRVRMMGHVADPRVFIRSLANRGHLGGLAAAIAPAARALVAGGFPTVLIETVGVGQAEVEIAHHADTTVVVLSPGSGDDVQASKAGILEIADVLVVNKSDHDGATDMVRDLLAMLRLREVPAGGWRVPVVATRGDTGEGVDDLLAALVRHHEHVAASGELREHRAARRTEECRAVALAQLVARLDDVFAGPDAAALLEDVATGRRSPGVVGKELAEQALGTNPRAEELP